MYFSSLLEKPYARTRATSVNTACAHRALQVVLLSCAACQGLMHVSCRGMVTSKYVQTWECRVQRGVAHLKAFSSVAILYYS